MKSNSSQNCFPFATAYRRVGFNINLISLYIYLSNFLLTAICCTYGLARIMFRDRVSVEQLKMHFILIIILDKLLILL